VPSGYHHPIANQRTAGEPEQVQGMSAIVDTPNHDYADVGVPVLAVDAGLSRGSPRRRQQSDGASQRSRN
jgi:hypothetical protein